jgi:lipopolysaccharide exporter
VAHCVAPTLPRSHNWIRLKSYWPLRAILAALKIAGARKPNVSIEQKLNSLKSGLMRGPLKSGGSIRNVLTILAGTAIAQAIGILITPVLVRIYTPEDFGTFATFIMLSNNLAMLSCLAYQGSIVLPRRNESGFILWASCLVLSCIVAVLVGLIVFILGADIPEWLGNPKIGPWLWLIPISVFAWGGFESTAMWCTRLKSFGAISKGTVQRRLGVAGGQFGLGVGVASPSESGLIIGQVFGELIGLFALARRALLAAPKRYWRKITWSNTKVLLHRYRRFPQFSLLASFAAALSRNMPVLCLGIYFGAATVGFFALAYRLLAAPMQLGISSVTRVFFERANRAKRENNLAELTTRTFGSLMVIACTPLVLVAIAATELVTLLLGDPWVQSATFLRWLTLFLFFAVPTSALDKLFVIQEKQHELALINGLLLVVTTAGLVVGGWIGNPNTAVGIFCTVAAFVWGLQCFRVLWLAGIKPQVGINIIFKELLQSLPFAVPMLLAAVLIDSKIVVSTIFVVLMAIFGLIRAKNVLMPSNSTN